MYTIGVNWLTAGFNGKSILNNKEALCSYYTHEYTKGLNGTIWQFKKSLSEIQFNKTTTSKFDELSMQQSIFFLYSSIHIFIVVISEVSH